MAVKVLDHGEVDLVDFMGGDQRVDQAAGVSLAKFNRARGDEAVAKIINYMMKHRHGTPFEHSIFTFRIKAPIFVAREWMRHRIGSYNELSMRYAEVDPEFYLPGEWRGPHPDNHQSSIPIEGNFDGWANLAYKQAKDTYRFLLDKGVANELARLVLPVSTYTEFVWTVNARSLMNFLSLRLGDDAQWEIREYATEIEKFFNLMMPLTWRAFRDNGNVAP